MTNKSDFRKWAKEQRKSVGEERLAQASAALCAAVITSRAYRRAPVLLLYAALPGELDLQDLFQHARADGKIVAYPRCGNKGQMTFFSIAHEKELVRGRYGIREPGQGTRAMEEIPQEALCVVPALVYDRMGHRLGYGGGYYDRFLAAHPCVTVGGCLRELYVDELPKEHTDIPVDTIFLV